MTVNGKALIKTKLSGSGLALAVGLLVAGCGKLGEAEGDGDAVKDLSEDMDQDGTPDACVDEQEFLATQAWPQVLASDCMTCHGPGGPAVQKNADLQLQPPSYPDFMGVNLQNLKMLAEEQVGGTSVLLLNPLGQRNHGGGALLTEDSPKYAILKELVERLNDTSDDLSDEEREACHTAATRSLGDVELLDAVGTFRKASLQLNGRLPAPEEVDQLVKEGETALPGLLRGLFKEDAFYERLLEVFNDQWLTDRYLGDGNNVLNNSDFPNLEGYYEGLSDEERAAARRSIAREPLELMAYIVRNDRPFTEIVTADYTVLNQYTARIFNNDKLSFSGGKYAEKDFQEGKIYVSKEEEGLVEWPHAGILSSPMFLNRYPTSPTNRNRHRARIVLRELLATDILKVADRPIDPAAAITFPNPTSEDPACRTCHTVIDPIAGAFQKFNDNDQERLEPYRDWYGDMAAPGFGTQSMTTNDIEDGGLPWLGQQIARDPRFPISVVVNIYKSLTGSAPLEFPDDPTDGSYAAWKAQDTVIRDIVGAFVADNFNLKTAIQQLVLSPYYRAKNTTAADAGSLAQLGAVGTGQLLTPELLNRKLLAVFGHTWGSVNDPNLLDDYRILYGGMDSRDVTERLTRPNGIMSAIMWRMATEMACSSVARDFALPKNQRRLFRDVDLETLPIDDVSRESPEGVSAIKANIMYLYGLMLGETLDPESAEMERAYTLFLETFHEGNNKLADDRVSSELNGDCQLRRDFETGEELPEDKRLTRDPRYVMRSWMAVLTYLLADYRFLYE